MKEHEAIERSLSKVGRVGKFIKAACDVFAVAMLLIWAALVVLSASGGFDGDGAASFSMNVGTLLYVSVIILVTALFLRTLSSIFAGVVKGESPFNRLQVKKMRLLGYLLVAKALVEAVFSMGSSLFAQLGGWDVMVIDAGVLAESVLYIDGGSLFMAAVLICLSVVFEYGALLQRLSDDAV